MTQLSVEGVVTEGITLDLWCGWSDLSEEWLVSNDIYLVKETYLKIWSRQHQEEWHRLFVEGHNFAVFAVT